MTTNTWFKVKGSKVKVTAYVTANTDSRQNVSRILTYFESERIEKHALWAWFHVAVARWNYAKSPKTIFSNQTRKRAIAKALQLKGHSDLRQSIWHIISIFWIFLFENIAFWEVPRVNHKCRSRGATLLVNNKLESVQLRKHCISTAEQYRARRSGIFSGLFGLKILFSDVLESAPGNRHVNFA